MSIEHRLIRWGQYMQTARDFGLGFPRRTVLHRCMVEGPAAGSPTGRGEEPVPSDIEAVESAMSQLPARDKRLAVRLYVEGKPVPVLRRAMRIDRESLEDMIARMHTRVGDALGDG